MEISISSNVAIITGNIKSVSDFQNIKSSIDSLITTHKNIIIELQDSISITSSVIGYFNKLVLKDKIDLHLRISNDQLMALLDDLNLASVLKARKV